VAALKAGEVEAALRRIGAPFDVVLVYGPDSGLVAERARVAVERAVSDPGDPFQVVKLDGDLLGSDPARLCDEAQTVGLFSARRAIWVRPTSRSIVPAVENLLRAPPLQETLVVIEAGDLARSAPLRTLCERSPRALALPCYADNERDLARLADETLRSAGLTIGREARSVLLGSLGADRLATRSELAKLLLYVEGQREVTLADVDATLSDVSGLALDAVIDAAFGGDRTLLEDGYRRLRAEGTAPLLDPGRCTPARARASSDPQRHRKRSSSAGSAVESWRGLHFSRKPALMRQLERWRSNTLARVVRRLQADILLTRVAPDLAEAVASKTLLDIAG
jgi:DNA polymerase-3 subunit delta